MSGGGQPRYGRAQHPNSQANLRPGAGAWREGATLQLRHGLRSHRPAPLVMSEHVERIADALADSVPLRGPDGDVLPQFWPALQAAALHAIQIERCRAFLATHGYEDERGRWRPENDALDRKISSYLAALDKLGRRRRSMRGWASTWRRPSGRAATSRSGGLGSKAMADARVGAELEPSRQRPSDYHLSSSHRRLRSIIRSRTRSASTA